MLIAMNMPSVLQGAAFSTVSMSESDIACGNLLVVARGKSTRGTKREQAAVGIFMSRDRCRSNICGDLIGCNSVATISHGGMRQCDVVPALIVRFHVIMKTRLQASTQASSSSSDTENYREQRQ